MFHSQISDILDIGMNTDVNIVQEDKLEGAMSIFLKKLLHVYDLVWKSVKVAQFQFLPQTPCPKFVVGKQTSLVLTQIEQI